MGTYVHNDFLPCECSTMASPQSETMKYTAKELRALGRKILDDTSIPAPTSIPSRLLNSQKTPQRGTGRGRDADRDEPGNWRMVAGKTPTRGGKNVGQESSPFGFRRSRSDKSISDEKDAFPRVERRSGRNDPWDMPEKSVTASWDGLSQQQMREEFERERQRMRQQRTSGDAAEGTSASAATQELSSLLNLQPEQTDQSSGPRKKSGRHRLWFDENEEQAKADVPAAGSADKVPLRSVSAPLAEEPAAPEKLPFMREAAHREGVQPPAVSLTKKDIERDIMSQLGIGGLTLGVGPAPAVPLLPQSQAPPAKERAAPAGGEKPAQKAAPAGATDGAHPPGEQNAFNKFVEQIGVPNMHFPPVPHPDMGRGGPMGMPMMNMQGNRMPGDNASLGPMPPMMNSSYPYPPPQHGGMMHHGPMDHMMPPPHHGMPPGGPPMMNPYGVAPMSQDPLGQFLQASRGGPPPGNQAPMYPPPSQDWRPSA